MRNLKPLESSNGRGGVEHFAVNDHPPSTGFSGHTDWVFTNN
jgi:hypothetical protein